MRDYLYFALPGLRSEFKIITYFNLAITMVLGGLWHGISFNYLIWGALHGLALAAQRWWQVSRGDRKPSPLLAFRVARGFATFHFVVFAWIFFRSESLEGAMEMLAQIPNATLGIGSVTPGYLMVMVVAAFFHYVPKEWYSRSQRIFVEAPALAQAAVVAVAMASIQYVSSTGSAPFVYQKF